MLRKLRIPAQLAPLFTLVGRIMRRRQFLALAAVVCLFFFFLSILRISPDSTTGLQYVMHKKPSPGPHEPVTWEEPDIVEGGTKPKELKSNAAHPIWYLLNEEQKKFEALKKRQSSTLTEAVKEYKKRYGIPPPPHFDKWFEFVQKNGVELVDEFDTIHDLLTPFWGLKPSTIRSRTKEALGFDNGLIGLSIRNHAVSQVRGAENIRDGENVWQHNATRDMMEKFIEYLPDMDLAFNAHDEPRVMVPNEDLVKLVSKAKKQAMPALNKVKAPINDFSSTSAELGDGLDFEETKLTRFSVLNAQTSWSHSRMSCPPDSPARQLEDDEQRDDLSKYGVTELGFVYNVTAMADICSTPSLSSTYGFFDRPNTFKVVTDLFPVFSQSKINSYADIVYPSPWYWKDRTPYEEKEDKSWTKKANRLYWRGSTTGGFSRQGGWRRQHRQRFVKKINAHDSAKVYTDIGEENKPDWRTKHVPRTDLKDLVDVGFSHVGQCDPGDCEAQREFFSVKKEDKDKVEFSDAYGYKYLLDMDGNAFSGRYYAFLKSRSLVYKLHIFQEWHEERIKPWVHYVPLSLQGDDWLEAVRFFDEASLGKDEGQRIAAASREWAKKSIRQVDMEAFFFRLLLE